MNIAISSVGSSTSIGLIKLIKEFNPAITILGLDINDYGYVAGSILADKYYKIEPYYSADYVDVLLAIFEKEKVDIFIPVHDFEIMKIAQNINKFNNVKITLASYENIVLFSDKYKASKAVETLGILTPKTVKNDFCGKKIVRKRVSVGSKGIRIFTGNERIHLENDEFLQEFIEGEEYTVDIFCSKSGKPISIIPRIRMEVKAGVSTKMKIVKDNELINQCLIIIQKYKLPGLSNIQFIKSKGKYYFLELNPRFGGGSIASIMASYNYIGDYLNIDKIDDEEDLLKKNLNNVKWNSVVTRYFSEVIYHE